MAKPDDRSDNVAHLQNHIQNTQENLREAREYLANHAEEISSEEEQQISAKNERREQSIQGFREEIKDEADDASTT